MDALIPALIAVLLAEAGSRTQALAHAAALARASAAPVLGAIAVTTVIGLSIAAAGGAAIAEMLTPDARALLAGLALLFAGVPMLIPRRKPVGPPRHLVPALAASQFGDASQFIVFAVAARSNDPLLATAGGVFGIAAAMVPPMLMGREWPGRIPVGAMRLIAATLLIVAGLWLVVGALRLS